MLRAATTLALPVGLAACALFSASTADAKARYMDLPEAVERAQSQ